MPRIIAGEFGGKRLKYPESRRFRPTMDKVKEALFSIIGEDILDARVLDLFAAAGGLGLEAISRGARQAVFVEQDIQAYKMLQENIKSLGITDRCLAVRQNVRTYLKQSKFFATHIFCDPPYQSNMQAETLALLATNPGLEHNTLIILEHDTGRKITLPDTLKAVDSRSYGETTLLFVTKEDLDED